MENGIALINYITSQPLQFTLPCRHTHRHISSGYVHALTASKWCDFIQNTEYDTSAQRVARSSVVKLKKEQHSIKLITTREFKD